MKNSKGFTLVELLVAISILGIIMVIALPQISNLQTNNQKTKYKKYADSMLSSGKLYTDSYTEDMFGNNTSGCVDIKYSDMKDRNLLKDIKVDGSTCSSNKTFIRVRKSNDHYMYETSVYCTDKNGKVVYEVTLPGTCDGSGPDITGPTISLSRNGSDWTKGTGLKTTIYLYDDYGLLENAKIKYAWYKGSTLQGSWTTKDFKNERYEGTSSAKLSETVTVPQNATGEYTLKVVPVDVRDANGNWLSTTFVSEPFKLDNTKPSCGSNNGQSTWTGSNRTINLGCIDNHSGCAQNPYSKLYNSGTTREDTITVLDNVGNSATCTYNVYVDKEAPTTPTSGAIGAVSGSNPAASIQTVAGGSSEVNNGSGLKEYRYLVTTSSTTPTNKSAFTTSRNYTRSCGTSYYAWAIAVDNVGNMSAVKSLGNTSDAADAYDTNWSACSKECGTGVQYKYNTCALKSTLSQSCNSRDCCSKTEPTGCGSWSWSSCTASCGSSGTKYETRTCNLKSAYDGTSCPGTITQTQSENTACNRIDCCSKTEVKGYGDWGSCSATCGGGKQYRDIYLKSAYNGSDCGKSTTQDEQACGTNPCDCSHSYGGSYGALTETYVNYWADTVVHGYTYNNCTHSKDSEGNGIGSHTLTSGQTIYRRQCVKCAHQNKVIWCPNTY